MGAKGEEGREEGIFFYQIEQLSKKIYIYIYISVSTRSEERQCHRVLTTSATYNFFFI